MNEQTLILQIANNFKINKAFINELKKSDINIHSLDYIQVFNDSLLKIAKLFGKHIDIKENYYSNYIEYDCSLIIAGVTFSSLLCDYIDTECKYIDDIINYNDNYDNYFSLQLGEFIPSLISSPNKEFYVQINALGNIARLLEEDDKNSILKGNYEVKSFYEYCYEFIAENNEYAYLIDSIIDRTGRKWLLWGSDKSGKLFITEYRDEGNHNGKI